MYNIGFVWDYLADDNEKVLEELCIMYIIHEELKSLQDLCTTSNTDIDMEYIT